MNSFLPGLLLHASEKTCKNSATSSDISCRDSGFSIVDDNARLPHYTLRLQAIARLSPEESDLDIRIRRWEGSIESTSTTASYSSSLIGSPRARSPHDDSFNSSFESLSGGGCQPICPQRRPSDPRLMIPTKDGTGFISSSEAAQLAIEELLLSEGDFLSDDDDDDDDDE